MSLRDLGGVYIQIPVSFEGLATRDFEAFCDVMRGGARLCRVRRDRPQKHNETPIVGTDPGRIGQSLSRGTIWYTQWPVPPGVRHEFMRRESEKFLWVALRTHPRSASGENSLHHLAMHIRQPEVTPLKLER